MVLICLLMYMICMCMYLCVEHKGKNKAKITYNHTNNTLHIQQQQRN